MYLNNLSISNLKDIWIIRLHASVLRQLPIVIIGNMQKNAKISFCMLYFACACSSAAWSQQSMNTGHGHKFSVDLKFEECFICPPLIFLWLSRNGTHHQGNL